MAFVPYIQFRGNCAEAMATFWSRGFGMVRDRFGTHWMIAAPGDGQ